MVSIYLDSSAYVKQFSQERGSASMGRIFEALEKKGKLTIVTSQWGVGESLAAIDRKFRRREIDQREKDLSMTKLLETTIHLSRTGLRIVPVKEDIVRASWPLMSIYGLSADDALHLISAVVGLASVFVAADEYLLKAAKQEGFETYNIEDKDEEEILLERLQLI